MSNYEEQEYNSESFDFSVWKRILKLMIPFKKWVIALLVLDLGIALLDSIFPYMNKMAIDYFVEGNMAGFDFKQFCIIYAILIPLQSINVYGFFHIAGKIEMKYGYQIRQMCFEKLHSLSFAYFDKTPIGWLMARMNSDVTRLAEIVSWGLLDMSLGVFTMIIIAILMLITNWQLALVILMVMPVLAVASYWFQTKILKNYREVRKINSQITSSFNEGITGAKTTKTMVLEAQNYQEFHNLTTNMKESSIRAAKLHSLFSPVVIALSSISTAFVLVLGGHQVLLQKIEFGTLFMFTQYTYLFFEPVRQVARLMAEFQMAQASGERVFSMLDSVSAIQDTPEVLEKYGSVFEPSDEILDPIIGDVEFKNIDFYYNKEEPVLSNFNLKVKAGQTVALVGETGSGKSSIVNLLCRFYEPISGEVLIDGVDYRKRSESWLHRQLGYVLQSPHLFSGSVFDNVRFGKEDATLEDVIEACKLVNAHDFIMELPNGYDSDVGEGGSKLSVGQKQLVSFARAILVNPALFILDEATASIDTETEKIIQYAIENILKGKTSFVIAHRLSTIVNADMILVIKKGIIVEQGTHEELMELKGYYYRLFTHQFNEDLEREVLNKQIYEV